MKIDITGLSPAEWQAASRPERLATLQKLEDLLSDEQKRHGCTIQTYAADPFDCGYYNQQDPEQIHLNENLLGPESLNDSVATVAHEGRHAYQYHCICFPDEHPDVDKSTIDTWEANYKKYVRPTIDFESYKNQPIEADAFSYEGQVIEAVKAMSLSLDGAEMTEPSRTATEKYSDTKDDVQPPAKRQAPPARADGVKLVSYSSEAHDAMRLAYYGAPTNARTPDPVVSRTETTIGQAGIAATSEIVNRTGAALRDPERAFNKYIDALQQRYGTGLVPRQADSIIALKMAQSGWQPEEVAAALRTCRTNTELPVQEVPAYVEKITAQAFGKAAREAAIERNPSMDLGR